MKKLLTALTLIAISYCSAEAQTNVRCTTVPKQNQKMTVENKTTLNSCKLVPKQVCSITADRRHVVCYKTYDGDEYKPANTTVTYYGPTGPMPGQQKRFETETILIKNENKTDMCQRDGENKVTTCYYSGNRICRDDNGYYYNCSAPSVTYTQAQTDNVVYLGSTGVVLK